MPRPKAIDIEIIYQGVLNKELTINSKGEIWRIGIRWRNSSGQKGVKKCKKKRAEHDTGDYLQISASYNGVVYSTCAHRLVFYHLISIYLWI